MEDKKISIIMPVRNTKKRHLKQAIDSILKQTYTNFELIIVDDNSDFKTKRVLNSYKDERITILNNEDHLGISKSLNIGIKNSKGDYIVRVDSDEINLPKRLEKQLKFMEKNENAGVSGCGYFLKKEEVFPKKDDDKIKEILKKGINPFDNSALMIRKSVLQDIKYSEAYDYIENLFLLVKLFEKTEFRGMRKALFKKRIKRKHPKKYLTEEALNTQTLIYLNMERFFNKACGEEFSIIRKLKDKKRISTKEYEKLLEKQDVIEYHPLFKNYAKSRCINPLIVFGIIKY